MGEITDELTHRIKTAASLGSPTGSGFHTILCPMCNDTQWGRSGFKFEDDMIIYNCFRGRCNATCVYKEGEFVSKKFRLLMEAIDVELPLEAIATNQKAKEKAKQTLNQELYEYVPLHDVELQENTDTMLNTGFTSSSYPQVGFLKSRGLFFFRIKSIAHESIRRGQRGTTIFVCKLDGYIIGAIYYTHKRTSSSPYMVDPASMKGLLYTPTGFIPQRPIIVEGVLDALSVPNGVAVLQNTVSRAQAYRFKDKNPILLPDRTNSQFFAVAKRYGWDISLPMWKGCKDANDALLKYDSKLVLSQQIIDNVYSDPKEAEIAMKFHEL